ncbi:MAG: SURF1 family protein [Gammaproteobacteria bacterium]
MEIRREIHLGDLHIRFNWLIAGCVLMTVMGLGRLGIWQLDRAAEQVEAQRALDARLQDNAPAIESLTPAQLQRSNPDLQNLHVSLSGEYLNERTILVLAEFFDSQIGYGVVTPFRLASNGELVLVSRGWTTGILPPDTPPYLNPVEGPVVITGQIHVRPEDARVISSEIDPSEWPLRIRTLEIDIISDILAQPLFPYEVRLTADQPGTLVRHWPAVNIDVNQNLFYAVQWFSFAFVVLIIALFASSNLWQIMREDGRKP